ncbi:9969_t:CDS:2 [Funneliformis mosseae]|uniref:9969_t:CDS:1 n=1 Tax=Funneliformis mosseae TaxID=27381 RepID=A0A9N9DC05_FUNMO|nr:9969_t:CDS:2 [Funneliformis mosseae]
MPKIFKAYNQKINLNNLDFEGVSFTSIFLVKVNDIGKDVSNSKFKEVDKRFKEELLIQNTSVQLGWLIDLQHK